MYRVIQFEYERVKDDFFMVRAPIPQQKGMECTLNGWFYSGILAQQNNLKDFMKEAWGDEQLVKLKIQSLVDDIKVRRKHEKRTWEGPFCVPLQAELEPYLGGVFHKVEDTNIRRFCVGGLDDLDLRSLTEQFDNKLAKKMDLIPYITKVNTGMSCKQGEDPREFFKKKIPLVALVEADFYTIGHTITLRLETLPKSGIKVFFYACSMNGKISNYKKPLILLERALSK